MSTTCPWCNSQNEFSLGTRDIKWYVLLTGFDYLTNRKGNSQSCSGQYRRIEEVHDVIGVRTGQLPKIPKTAGPLPPKQHHVDDDDIHSYIRVHVLGIAFRIGRTTPLNSGLRMHNIEVSNRELEDIDSLTRLLAENFHLSEEDCRTAISDRRQIPLISNSHASHEYTVTINEMQHSYAGFSIATEHATKQGTLSGILTRYMRYHTCHEPCLLGSPDQSFTCGHVECLNCKFLSYCWLLGATSYYQLIK